MADKNYQFDWESRDLRRFLRLRDRFTQAAVKKDFERDPDGRAVLLDEVKQIYATPVQDNHYTVIWQLLDEKLAKITAVVASQLRDENPAQFRSKLEQVVDMESHGMVKLG